MNFMEKETRPTQCLISIIVPVYGVEKYIEKCAISLFEQSYDNIEYIFIDDKTPDNSIEILKDVIKRYKRLSLGLNVFIHHNEKNIGLASSRKVGYSLAKGVYIANIDSDDWIEPDYIELMVSTATSSGAEIVLCDFYLDWGDRRKSVKVNYSENALEQTRLTLNTISMPCVCFRLISRSLYERSGILPVSGINLGEDYLFSSLITYYAYSIAKVDKPLYHYFRSNSTSYTSTFNARQIDDVVETFKRLEEFYKEKKGFESDLLQGKLVKKGDLFLKCRTVEDVLNVDRCIYTPSEISRISMIHKFIYFFTFKKRYRLALSVVIIYRNIMRIIQILKGR